MNKQQFFAEIRQRIGSLPQQDINRSIDFYAEMIDDRIEEGLSEEEAVAAMGTPEEIAAQILSENLRSEHSEKLAAPKRTFKAWEIVLLVIGSPLWVPLLLAAAIIVLSLYIVLWSVIIVLYAADLCFAAGAISGIVGGAILFCTGRTAQALLFFGAGITCIGLTILWFVLSTAAAKGMWQFTKLPFTYRKGYVQ